MTGSPHRPRSSSASLFRFCPFCGGSLRIEARHGRERPVCPACGFVHWRNPVVGVAGVVSEQAVVGLLGEEATRLGAADPHWRPHPESRRLLLVRRAASEAGLWCLPCGYVEFDEEIREALVREMREETGLTVEPGRIIAVRSNFHDPDHQSVGIWFEARPVGGRLRAGDDADQLDFFAPDAISVPLAFPTDAEVLRELARTGLHPGSSGSSN